MSLHAPPVYADNPTPWKRRIQYKTQPPTAFYAVGVMRYFQVAVSTCSPVMETVVSAVMVCPL